MSKLKEKLKAAREKKQPKKVIKVNLAMQILEAYEDDTRIFRFECVTGDSDHPTDKGTFTIWDTGRRYVSNTYHVPMHYALFFTKDRKAIHQYHGQIPLSVIRSARQNVSEWFGSHGCVRLTEPHAKALFNWADKGNTTVSVS